MKKEIELQQKLNILKVLSIYESFIHNCLNYSFDWRRFYNKNDIFDFVDVTDYDLIDMCFNWGSTPEGYEFWSKINIMYNNMYNMLRNG